MLYDRPISHLQLRLKFRGTVGAGKKAVLLRNKVRPISQIGSKFEKRSRRSRRRNKTGICMCNPVVMRQIDGNLQAWTDFQLYRCPLSDEFHIVSQMLVSIALVHVVSLFADIVSGGRSEAQTSD